MDRVKKMKINFLWFYLMLIWVAEITLAKLSLVLGALLHIIIVFSIFFHGTVCHKTEKAKIYISLSLVSLLRIVNLSIPIVDIQPIYWYILVGIPGWLAVLLFIKVFGLSTAELGLKAGQVLLQLVIGITLGIPLGLLNYLALRPEPLIPEMGILSLTIAISIISVFVASLEELVFRGILFKLALKQGLSFAYIFASLAYASMYIYYLSIGYIVLAILAAACFCRLVKLFDSILAPLAGHIVAGTTTYLIWPFYYDVFVDIVRQYYDGTVENMISVINPLAERVNGNIISEWPSVIIYAIIFLVILLVLRELSATIADYSTAPKLQFSQHFIRQLNFGLIPLLYVFALNVFVRIVECLIY
jgi:hypothetical protein